MSARRRGRRRSNSREVAEGRDADEVRDCIPWAVPKVFRCEISGICRTVEEVAS